MKTTTSPRFVFVQLVALLSLALTTNAQEAVVSEDDAPTFRYVRMTADGEGQSHFEEGTLDLAFQDYAPPAKPIAIHALQNVQGATLLHMPGHSFEDWHPAPRRQFAFILQGTVEVTVGDGEVRQFRPGDIVLLEDTTGPGHTTRVVSDEAHVGLMVPVAQD